MKTTLDNSYYGKDHFHGPKGKPKVDSSRDKPQLQCDHCGSRRLNYLPGLNGGYAQYACVDCTEITTLDLY